MFVIDADSTQFSFEADEWFFKDESVRAKQIIRQLTVFFLAKTRFLFV